MCYEAFKEALAGVGGVSEAELSAPARVSAGALAGLIAQTFVYPFDVVRLGIFDDKFTPTKHLTPPLHHSSRPAARRHHYNKKGGEGP